MNPLQIFDYNGMNITFENNGKVMVNATEMAKAFGKRPVEWLRTEQSEDMIKCLAEVHKCTSDDLLIVRKGNFSDDQQGTWMHEDVALIFAQWLSPEFYVWCNNRIKELLTTGKTQLDTLTHPTRKQLAQWVVELEEQTEKLQKENAEKEKHIQQIAPKAEYYDQVLQAENTWHTTTIAKELGMSAKKLNHELHIKGVHFMQDGHWVLYSKYQGIGLTKTKTSPYYNSKGEICTSLLTVWTEKGREFIHKKMNANLQKSILPC